MNELTKTCLVLAVSQAIQVNDALSATIVVNTTADIDGGGSCTLREAIVSINNIGTASTGCNHTGLFGVDDTVNFDPGLSGETITLTQAAELDIATDLSINGLGRDHLTINGMNNDRVFRNLNATLTINDLTITGGSASDFGGGIVAGSLVNLFNIKLSDNTASSAGGGIFISGVGSANIQNSTITGNTAYFAGGIYAGTSDVKISSSSITGNTAITLAGGIHVSRSTVNLINTNVSGNTSFDLGGGVGVYSDNYGNSSLSLSNSTVSDNTSFQEGGGLVSFSNQNGISNVSVNFSTISENSSFTEGGGIHISSTGTGAGTVSLNNSTVSGNFAASNGGGLHSTNSVVTASNSTFSDNYYGAVHLIGSYTQGTATFTNTILANSIERPDCFRTNGAVYLGEGNIIENDSMVPETTCASPSALKGDPGLGSLANNGGPTQTHALLPNSLAIGAGVASESCEMPDQRGVERVDGVCDIGAYTIDRSGFFVIPLANGKVVVIPN